MLPAILALLGTRVNALHIPGLGGTPHAEHGIGPKLARVTRRAPVPIAIAATALVAVIALPFFQINLGSAEMVTINHLVDIVERIAGVTLRRRYNLDAPKGVRGRSSDNTLIRELLGWEPGTPLRVGMERTYEWIRDELASTSTAVRKS